MTTVKEVSNTLTITKLSEGHRPSLYVLGMTGAHALRQAKVAIFMLDALGMVHLMPRESVTVLTPPRVTEEALDSLEEADAIRALAAQGDTEDQIFEYLVGRSKRTRR